VNPQTEIIHFLPLEQIFVIAVGTLKPPGMSESDPGFLAAVEEAKKGFAEGGVPIGACLVSKEGKILGQGHNMRVQKGSATLHVRASQA
jgi:Cytidine and deoxycytidylate deaminase zinc-binding region